MPTIRETLRTEAFPIAHFANIIKDKSRGTINQDKAADMAMKLIDKDSVAATRAIATEIMGRLAKRVTK